MTMNQKRMRQKSYKFIENWNEIRNDEKIADFTQSHRHTHRCPFGNDYGSCKLPKCVRSTSVTAKAMTRSYHFILTNEIKRNLQRQKKKNNRSTHFGAMQKIIEIHFKPSTMYGGKKVEKFRRWCRAHVRHRTQSQSLWFVSHKFLHLDDMCVCVNLCALNGWVAVRAQFVYYRAWCRPKLLK